MPFEDHGNRSFTATSIAKDAPPASSAYGLADASRWIYIGETTDIQAELLRHLHNPPAFLREYLPSGFTYELSTVGHRIDRQNQLVFELEPIGNRRVRAPFELDISGEGARSLEVAITRLWVKEAFSAALVATRRRETFVPGELIVLVDGSESASESRFIRVNGIRRSQGGEWRYTMGLDELREKTEIAGPQ
jgi:hypothetical protein